MNRGQLFTCGTFDLPIIIEMKKEQKNIKVPDRSLHMSFDQTENKFRSLDNKEDAKPSYED